jgi:hypothetical protein
MLVNELAQIAPYHEELNPLLWDEDSNLKLEVRYKLLAIAKHFIDFLDIGDQLKLRDITISGSNASYGYSETSDIDLHLIADIPKEHPELSELFDAKKNQYNFNYDITIHNIDVELYVQDAAQEHVSAGIYSVLDDQWLSEPTWNKPNINDREVRAKARNYSSKINQALKSTNIDQVNKVLDDIKKLRKDGLDRAGEYSVENLAFKLLRAKGKMDRLRKHKSKLESELLSLENQYES